MARHSTFPTLYDDVLQISITKLKEFKYLEKNRIKSGVLSWSFRGQRESSISIKVDTYNEPHHIELDYKTNGEPRNYKIRLVTEPSNLGKGEIWYFLCPHTMKRCRKLYCIDGYFLHREAFNGCMYESQIQSKRYRQLDKTFGAYFKEDGLYSQLYKKHFKKTYAGKPTKKYLRIIKQIQEAEKVDYNALKSMF